MKRILIIAGLLVAVGIAYGVYEFNRTGKDTSKQSADYTLSSTELANAFESDESAANQKYLDKVIEVEGELIEKEVGEPVIFTLKGTDMVNLRAEFSSGVNPQVEVGSMVKLKGICTGYLLDVVLNECVIVD